MPYDEDEQLWDYVLRYLTGPFLTEADRERMHAENMRHERHLVDFVRERHRRRETGQSEEQWKPLRPSLGYTEFLEDIVSRVLSDREAMARVNRCPKCHRVLRTPQATVCVWCWQSP
jgi:hypothetical protein